MGQGRWASPTAFTTLNVQLFGISGATGANIKLSFAQASAGSLVLAE